MGRGRFGGGKSKSHGFPKFGSPFSKKAVTKKSGDDEKAPPPAKKHETTRGETRADSFFQSMSDGFGFAMGHRFVEAIFGPRTIRHETVLPERVEVATLSSNDDNEKLEDYSKTCSISYNAFQDCLYVEGNNLRKCHLFMDSLFECRRNSSSYNF